MWFPDTPSWKIARNAIGISSDDVRFNGDLVDLAMDNAGATSVKGEWPNGVSVAVARVDWRKTHWLGTVQRYGDHDDFLFDRPDLAERWAQARVIEEAVSFELDHED